MTPIERLAKAGFDVSDWGKVSKASREAYCCAVTAVLTELRAMASEPDIADAGAVMANVPNIAFAEGFVAAIDVILTSDGGSDGSTA